MKEEDKKLYNKMAEKEERSKAEKDNTNSIYSLIRSSLVKKNCFLHKLNHHFM